MFKIVETDNFGGDYPDESFLNLPAHRDREVLQELADKINAVFSCSTALRHWVVVELPYKLAPGFEP